MLNKINHKPQSHAKVCDENEEENKEKNDWLLFFKRKRSIYRISIYILDIYRYFESLFKSAAFIQNIASYNYGSNHPQLK